jgi:ribosomal protein S28E/S33
VQDRQNTTALDKYYKDNETLPIRKTYGSTRRQITNLNDVAQRLQLHYGNTMTVQLLQSDTHTLQQQIMQYVYANVLVLGHGAGMVHLLWMKPRTCVVEIMTRRKKAKQNGAVQGCRRLCRILQFRLQRIIVREVKDVVRVKDVIQCLTTMQNHTHGPRRRTKKHYSQPKKKITVAKTKHK